MGGVLGDKDKKERDEMWRLDWNETVRGEKV